MAAKDAELFHVLAVDDCPINRKVIERQLIASSYQVITVDSGGKALEILGFNSVLPIASPFQNHDEKIDLIITDFDMPEMTGYELLKKIKESESLKDIPVVIMSSENIPARISSCLEGGAADFFLKPVQISDVSKLRTHIVKVKGQGIQVPPISC